MVQKKEAGECILALCYFFQHEENKSICEVTMGPECTFSPGACGESPRGHVYEFVCICGLLPGSSGSLLCHWEVWLASLVITKAWLCTDITRNVLEYTCSCQIFTQVEFLHYRLVMSYNEPFHTLLFMKIWQFKGVDRNALLSKIHSSAYALSKPLHQSLL